MEMVKHEMVSQGLQYRVESVGCDFEVAIQVEGGLKPEILDYS